MKDALKTFHLSKGFKVLLLSHNLSNEVVTRDEDGRLKAVKETGQVSA